MNLHEIYLAAQLAKNDINNNINLSDYYTKSQTDDLISGKVDKADGMGLSQNSFTNADKSKLDDLENYDDAGIKTDIAWVSNQAAINSSTLGYSVKNLLINNCKTTTKNGVTATVNDDKSITLSGVSTKGNDYLMFVNMATGVETTDQFANNRKFLPNGKYIVSGGNANCVVQITVSTDNTTANNLVSSTGRDISFTINDNHKYVWFRLLIKANADFSTPVTVYPMIRSAEIIDATYEQYIPSVEERLAAVKSQADSNENEILNIKIYRDTGALDSGDLISGSMEDIERNNFNYITQTGQYTYINSPANRPGPETSGILLVFRPFYPGRYTSSFTYIAQVAIAGVDAGVFNSSIYAGVFIRTSSDEGKTWSSWRKFSMLS